MCKGHQILLLIHLRYLHKNDVNIIFPSKDGAFKNTLSQMKIGTETFLIPHI